MKEFFEYKYIEVEDFYSDIIFENYTYKESAFIQLYNSSKIINKGKLYTLIVYSTILSELAKYEDNLNDFMDVYEIMINYYNNLPLSKFLTEEEKFYLDQDIISINNSVKK